MNKPAKHKVGYKGYLSDTFGWGSPPSGTVFCAVWDTEFGSGSADHRGYYAWMCKPVNDGDQQDIWAPGCAGTRESVSCLGSADPDNAAGHEVDNTPLGTIAPHGGLRPIPVPLPMNPVEGDTIHLSWNAVDVLGDTSMGDAQYDLYYVVREEAEGCAAPTADEFTFLKTVAGTSTDVTTGELGFNPDEKKGVYFALRIRYPNAGGGTEVVSRYLSANSQCIAFGGIAVNVVNIEAKWLRRNQVQVSWETELEDGVVGFYVQRAFTPNGPFERVSDLVPANGEPSKYTFIDTVTVNGRIAASGLYYKIEAVDANEGQKVFGPAQAELPTGGHRKIKTRRGFRF